MQHLPALLAESGDSQSLLSFYYAGLGPIYLLIFLALSVVLLALVLINLLTIRRQRIAPLALVRQFAELVDAKRFQEAYDLSKRNSSLLGRTLSTGLAHVASGGYGSALVAMREVAAGAALGLRGRLSYIKLLGWLSMLIGLIAAVDGMLGVCLGDNRAPDGSTATAVVQGLVAALVKARVGLYLAAPALLIHFWLSGRLAKLLHAADLAGNQLMSRFQNVGTKPIA